MILTNRYNVTLEYALNGKEAVDKVMKMEKDQGRTYDVIFMDWNMPIMNGV
jgi:CheY-like chemotaxis protein